MRRISARTLVNHIRAGMDDSTLMEKHELTHEGLREVFSRLVQEGLVSSMELFERTSLSESSLTRSFKDTGGSVLKCPSCGYELSGQLDRCPHCEKTEPNSDVELLVDMARSADPLAMSDNSNSGTSPISENTVASMVDGLFERSLESESTVTTNPSAVENNSKNRALLKAASRGPYRFVEQLLNGGTDVNARGKHGSTPLMRSSFKNHVDISRLLIERGAEVDATNEHGNTPLIVAAMFGHMEIAALLISKGANVNSRNVDRKTPLKYAKERGHRKVAELLSRYGAQE
jgi:hypothetical protein